MGHEFETTLDDVRQALSFLDCTARMTWVTVAFAIKNEFGEAGFDCWDRWSQGDKRYKSKEALAVWKSAGVTGKTGTKGIGGLFDMAKKAGYTFEKKALTPEQRETLRLEHEARREKVLEQQAADAAWCAKMADAVASAAAEIVEKHLKPVGGCPYIGQKRITPYGALFPREPLILIVDTKSECTRLIVGGHGVREYWQHRKTDAGKAAQEHEFSLSIGRGCLVLPMQNMAGQVRNLQVITRAKDAPPKKLFIKCGEKTGTYLRLGDGPAETELATEGWATGCTLHKASGLPVWVTWDCGGLYNWASEMLAQGRGGSEFLICGDDDAATDKNPGKTKALAAAQLLGSHAVFPVFPPDLPADKERSDFNDLQFVSGLPEVTAQINAGLEQLSLGELPPAPSSNAADFEHSDAPPVDAYNDYANYDVAPPSDLPPAPDLMLPPDLDGCFKRYALIADDSQSKIWDSHQLKILKQKAVKDFVTPAVFKDWLNNTEQRRTTTLASVLPLAQKKAAAVDIGGRGLRDALERYIYLNPSQNVWDSQEREVVAVNSLRLAIADCYDDWLKHPERKEIKARNLVFDPTQKTPTEGYINRFTGLAVKAEGDYEKCQAIAKLLVVLCNHDEEVLRWLTRWLAYPLQNVGAKMQSAVLMHSDVHGSGKSYFFDGVMGRIYGDYSNVFGQTQLESQYNDWMSECLFGVFEEVLSRGQKHSHTGTIKHMVSGKTFYVNKKFMSGWQESNHMNMAFVSNEVQPLPVEPSDRRFLVVWPESKLIEELKTEVDRELNDGGAEAFFNFLLSVDLEGFTPYTEPPMTEAKQRLIDFGLPVWQVFYEEWKAEELEFKYGSVRTRDLYKAFERYCKERNEHCMGMNKFTQLMRSKENRVKDLHYKYNGCQGKAAFFVIGSPPEKMTRQEWLGSWVQAWDSALNKNSLNQYSEAG